MNNKTDDLVVRFQRRSLKKYYNMLMVNQTRTLESRKQFRVVLDREYFRHLKDYLTKWKRQKAAANVKRIKKRQMVIEEQIEEVVGFKNDENDILFKQDQVHKEMVSSHQDMGRKVMKSTIAAWRNHRYMWAFYQWKESSDHFANQKKKLNHEIIDKIRFRVSHNAFT